MKFCKDCRHAEHIQKGAEGQWFCRHPVAGWFRDVDVVTGEDQNLETPCKTARMFGACGFDDPKFWEPADGSAGFVP
jgi:hypothetical protein